MKNVIKIVCLAWLFVAGCTKEDKLVVLEGGTAPVLSKSNNLPFVLTQNAKDNNILTLTWTNPNYVLNTGLSSQTVSYLVQIDKVGSNFSSSLLQEVSVSGDLGKTFTVGELNSIMNKMELDADVAQELELRVKSSLGATAAPLYSNAVKVTATPYLDVVVPLPSSGSLYITGGATPGGWQAGNGDPAPVGHTFTRVNATTFELIVTLKANDSYLFLPVHGSWSAKYGFTGANNQNNVNGDTFKADGGDIKSPAEAGLYKITVDFRTGRFTVVKQ